MKGQQLLVFEPETPGSSHWNETTQRIMRGGGFSGGDGLVVEVSWVQFLVAVDLSTFLFNNFCHVTFNLCKFML